MPVKRVKKEWADPNREGQAKGKEAERFCSKCGNTVKKARILKSLNLCEYCVNELREKRDGITSCRGCGKIEPLELKEHNGYCTQCICSACGKPDPQYVRKTGLCFQCAVNLGDFCRSCGKEAAAQVRKNKGFCDECVAAGRHKTLGRHRRSTGYQGKRWDDRGSKHITPGADQSQTATQRAGDKSFASESRRDMPISRGRKMFLSKTSDPRRSSIQKPGFKSSASESKREMPITRSRKPFPAQASFQRQATIGTPAMTGFSSESKPEMPTTQGKKPFLPKNRVQKQATHEKPRIKKSESRGRV